jgi:hypothetical protein
MFHQLNSPHSRGKASRDFSAKAERSTHKPSLLKGRAQLKKSAVRVSVNNTWLSIASTSSSPIGEEERGGVEREACPLLPEFVFGNLLLFADI